MTSLGAAAFTSARNAAPSPAPAAQAVPTAKPARPQTRVASLRRARAGERLTIRENAAKRVASRSQATAEARRLAAVSRPVSLERTVEMPAPSAAPAAPAGSIPAMVTAEARRAGVSPALAHAVVKVESRYQPNVTGHGGFVGLMQLSYRTAQGMGFRGSRKALYEPSNNLTYGMRYLAEAVRLSGGNTCAAVSKYQGGHGVRGVTRAGAVYCAKVKRFMAEGVPASAKVASN